MKRNLFALLSLLVLASMMLSACGGAVATEAPAAPATEAPATEAPVATEAPAAEPKVITIAYSQEPDNVIGFYSNMTYAAWLTQIFFAGLNKWDGEGNLVPDLATEVPTVENGGLSADGMTITYHLKPDLKWSDGEPITSKDVVFTWKQQVDPANAPISRYGYDKIDSIDTPDDVTAVIHMKELYPGYIVLFNSGPNSSGPLLPAHLLEGKTSLEKDPFIHQPTIASGPFMLTEWVPGDHMTLLPNPNYYGGKPKLDQINIKIVPDPETALKGLQTGDIDFDPDFAESDIATLQGLEPAVHPRVDPGPQFEHLFFNLGTAAGVTMPDGTISGKSDKDGFCPFQQLEVRKAIMLGINRQAVVDTLLGGATTVPASLWPNSTWYNNSLTAYPYDVDQANKLLDDAGYAVGSDGIRAGKCNGKDVKFSLGIETTTKQLRIDNVLVIQSDLQKLGIEIKPNHIPAGTFFGSYSEGADMPLGNFDMAIYTTGFFPDPDPGDSFLCSGVTNKDNPSGGNSAYHFCDPALDDLFKQAAASADPAVRKVAFDAIQKYQYDNVLFIPLYARANVYGYTDRLIWAPTSTVGGWPADIVNWDVK